VEQPVRAVADAHVGRHWHCQCESSAPPGENEKARAESPGRWWKIAVRL